MEETEMVMERIVITVKKIYFFYKDGFNSMKVGKKLWLIIGIKIIILFGIMKWLFFPNFLDNKFDNDTQKSYYILEQLTKE
jgi:hypothetical protein